jgi:hypothetical protein
MYMGYARKLPVPWSEVDVACTVPFNLTSTVSPEMFESPESTTVTGALNDDDVTLAADESVPLDCILKRDVTSFW